MNTMDFNRPTMRISGVLIDDVIQPFYGIDPIREQAVRYFMTLKTHQGQKEATFKQGFACLLETGSKNIMLKICDYVWDRSHNSNIERSRSFVKYFNYSYILIFQYQRPVKFVSGICSHLPFPAHNS